MEALMIAIASLPFLYATQSTIDARLATQAKAKTEAKRQKRRRVEMILREIEREMRVEAIVEGIEREMSR